MSVLRFFMLMSLVVWIGGIIFFAFVLAPTVFSVLPTRQLAGSVVQRALPLLHWMGIGSGLVFLGTSIALAVSRTGSPQLGAVQHLLVVVMIVLTLVAHFAIGTKMMALSRDMQVIDNVSQDDPRRVEFNRLHHWSTRVEVTVLGLGLIVLYLTARTLK